MASYNRVIIMGNLTRDPELRHTPSGAAVCDLRVAVNESYRSKDGERVERPLYVDVVVWNQQAETCNQYLAKGSPIFVEGRLQYDEWKTPQGETRSKLRIIANRVQFMSSGQHAAANAERQHGAEHAPEEPAAGAVPHDLHDDHIDDDEDVPF